MGGPEGCDAMSESVTSGPRRVPFVGLPFQPRFAYGEQAELAEVVGAEHGTALGCGFARLAKASIPWTVRYDEVLLVLEGAVTVRTPAGDLEAGPLDCIWLPKGTELRYEADEALVFYAIHPVTWSEAET